MTSQGRAARQQSGDKQWKCTDLGQWHNPCPDIGGNKENTSDSFYVIKGDLVANTVTPRGSNPIRMPNSQFIEAQNAATNSQVLLLGLDGSNQTVLRGGDGPKSVFIQTFSGAEGASMTDAGLWNFPGGLTVGQGISSDGSGLKHQSVSIGRISPRDRLLLSN